jgi:hypothetical protein
VSWFYCFYGATLDSYRENIVALGSESCSSSWELGSVLRSLNIPSLVSFLVGCFVGCHGTVQRHNLANPVKHRPSWEGGSRSADKKVSRRSFLIMFTGVRDMTLSWDGSSRFSYLHLIYLGHILVLLFPSMSPKDFRLKFWKHFSSPAWVLHLPPILYTLIWKTWYISGRVATNCETTYYVRF